MKKVRDGSIAALLGFLSSIPTYGVVADRYLSDKEIPKPKSVCYIQYYKSTGEDLPDSGCTGTLIRPNRILTAAHCTDALKAKDKSTAVADCGGRSFDVNGFESNPEYNPSPRDDDNHIHDVAILSISGKNIPGTKNFVTPMVLADTTAKMNQALSDPSQCAIYGYGQTADTSPNATIGGRRNWGELMVATIDYVDGTSGVPIKGWKDSQNKIYIGPKVHAAHGDSGGPILCKQSDGSMVQVAVTTLEEPVTLVTTGKDGKPHNLGDEYFSAHEAIPFNLNWIEQTADLPALSTALSK